MGLGWNTSRSRLCDSDVAYSRRKRELVALRARICLVFRESVPVLLSDSKRGAEAPPWRGGSAGGGVGRRCCLVLLLQWATVPQAGRHSIHPRHQPALLGGASAQHIPLYPVGSDALPRASTRAEADVAEAVCTAHCVRTYTVLLEYDLADITPTRAVQLHTILVGYMDRTERARAKPAASTAPALYATAGHAAPALLDAIAAEAVSEASLHAR